MLIIRLLFFLIINYNLNSGGCFPLHYDNPGPPNRRALTCLFYLNENWQEGDGGEVELQPFLSQKITLAPLYNRLVIFESDKMLHRVLPAVKERIVFTLWIDGMHVNNINNDVNLKQKHIDLSRFMNFDSGIGNEQQDEDDDEDGDIARQIIDRRRRRQEDILLEKIKFFQRSPLQRVISRVIYEADYEESLKQCMIEAAKPNLTKADEFAGKCMLAEHNAYIKSMRGNQMLSQFLDALLDWKMRQGL
jgi:hypothetical protein